MAIFRSRALEAANRSAALDIPLLLPQPRLGQQLHHTVLELGQALGGRAQRRGRRSPELLQHDPTECGAVSLAIVLRYHGCHVPLSSLRRACGVSRDGSDAANLVRAAKLYGLEAKGFKKGLEALKGVSLPAIVFWNFDHFLVLEAIEAGRYWLNDPASGRRCVELEEFDRCYTGVVLTLQPGPAFAATPPPAPAAKVLGGRLWGLRTPRRLMALGASLGVTTLLLTLLPGALGGAAGVGWPWGLVLAGLMGVGVLLQPPVQALGRALQQRGASRLQRTLLSLPDWVLQQHFSAELSGRHGQLPPLAAFLSQHLWPVLPGLLAALLWGVLLLPQQPALSLVLVGGLGVVLITSRWSAQLQRSLEAQQRLASRRPAALLQGGLQDPDTLKASALERDLFVRWAGLEALAARARQRGEHQRHRLGWIPELLGWSLLPLLLVVGMVAAAPGQGGSPVALLLMGLALALLQQRGRGVLRLWADQRAAVLNLQALEEQPLDPLLSDPAVGLPRSDQGEAGPARLELEAVTFGYVPVQPPLLEGFSLVVEPGQRIAIVGGSASGKSTLARLMAGLLQPTAGVVKLDGQPLLAWPRQRRLQAIAMVQQGMPLLGCSVRDNLTLWNSTMGLTDLEQACAAAAILERIEALPQGFDTPLGPAGWQLSGGEQQRLQLAQALLQRPALLILDEATSALDARTEWQVEQGLRRLPCTQVVVAHRLSTIRDADRILVLEHGRVVQSGTHGELAAQVGSPYQTLLLEEDAAASMGAREAHHAN